MGRAKRPKEEAVEQVTENLSRGEIQRGQRLLEGMEKIAGEPLEIDRTLAASIPTDNPEEALLWLRGDRSLIPDPEEVAPGMQEAARAVLGAIDQGQRIALFCDYDVDGVTGGEIMRNALGRYGAEPLMGYASAADGYGITEDFVRRAHAEGCKMLVTVDVGSAAQEAIALAQDLGMTVVVTDHHKISGDLTADHHLNPGLWDPRPSEAVGSQMAWYLAAAMMREREGEIPEEHYGENLFLAGMGCVSDWGPHMAMENRPFLRATKAPEGVRLLAEGLYEDASSLEKLWKTSTLLNLAKRTPFVSGEDAARVLRASSPEEVAEARAILEDGKKRQDAIAAQVRQEAAEVEPTGSLAFCVTEAEGAAGSTGSVAPDLANRTGRPAFVFAPLKEEDGEQIYKFSGRVPDGDTSPIGNMSADKELQELLPTCGGHERVFSGECRKEDIPRVQAAMERWAQETPSGEAFSPETETMSIGERRVSPERIQGFHAAARQMAPYHKNDNHHPPALSVEGKLVDIRKQGFRTLATLEMADGKTLEVQIGSVWDSSTGKFQLREFEKDTTAEVVLRFQPGEAHLAVEATL